MYTGINDANGNDCSDTITSSVGSISAEHRQMHLGHVYRAAKLYSITNAGTVYVQFKTGVKYTHLKQLGLSVDLNSILITMIESPVVTDGTTAISVNNSNRPNLTPSVNKLFSDPTSVSGGNNIDVDFMPAATVGQVTQGIVLPSDTEWILKPNTNYVFSLTNQGSTTSQVLVKFLWYEL